MASDRATAAPAVDYSKKWYVMAAVGAGVILATIDGTIVNIALPTIRTQLSTTLPVVQWVTVAYLLTLATLTLAVGRWGDISGKKRIYGLGFVVFTIASVLCGLAPTVGFLIGFRVVQALGAVMILALGPAILTEAFPFHERGKALGWIGTFVSIGVVTGPVVGGLLISAFDWRAIFFVNVPVGIVGLTMALRFVPATPPVGRQRFDYPGAALMSLTLLSISLAVTSGQELGYGSPVVLGLLGLGAVLAAGFVAVELGSPNPMIDLRMFRNRLLSVSIVTGFLTFVAIAAVFFLLPFYLEEVLGFTTRLTGFALGVPSLALGVVSPLAGSWSDRIGVRRLTFAGLVVLFFTYAGFQLLGTDTSFLAFSLLSLPVGIGMAIFQSPNNSAILGSVPREYMGIAGGMLALTRLLGQVVGVAVLGSVWAARVLAQAGPGFVGDAASAPPVHQVEGLHDTAVVISVLVGLGVLAGWYGMRRESRDEATALTAAG